MNLKLAPHPLSLKQAIDIRVSPLKRVRTPQQLNQLHSGEILLDYDIVSGRVARVQVEMLLNRSRQQIWQQLSNYENWPSFLPNIVSTSVIDNGYPKRIQQAAGFQIFGLVPHVKVELLVREQPAEEIVFEGISGSFKSFQAALTLQDCEGGVFLRYFVAAELLWPMPKSAIEQGIVKILPNNLKALRAQLRQPEAA